MTSAAIVRYPIGLAPNAIPSAVGPLGLKLAYLGPELDWSDTDGPVLVLGVKLSGADGVYLGLLEDANVDLAERLAVEHDMKLEGEVMGYGYGQALLDDVSGHALGSNVVVTNPWAPVEAKTPATKRFQAELRNYAGYTGVPNFGIYTGYIDCDLAIRGLQAQGDHLDPAKFVHTVRTKVRHFNPGGGLGCADTDVSAKGFGTAPKTGCAWAVRLKDDRFQVVTPKQSKQRFWTGKLITSSTSPTTTTR